MIEFWSYFFPIMQKKANEILLSEMIKLLDTIGCNQLPKMQPEQPHSRTDIK